MRADGHDQIPHASFPARGTWIEILMTLKSVRIGIVVPRKGNVD